MLSSLARGVSLFMLVIGLAGCASSFSYCTNDWKITGYYTPDESDFEQHTQVEIHVNHLGNFNFPKGFIDSVRLEGWGKTRLGWYLGFYNHQWHSSRKPLNSIGQPLVLGVVAVDNSLIANGKVISIPRLWDTIKSRDLIATDVGSMVKGKHIDIYTGEGETARKLTYDISGWHQVCFY